MPTTARAEPRTSRVQNSIWVSHMGAGYPRASAVTHCPPAQGVREQEWVRSDGARIEVGPLTRDASLADGVNHYTKHPPQSFLL